MRGREEGRPKRKLQGDLLQYPCHIRLDQYSESAYEDFATSTNPQIFFPTTKNFTFQQHETEILDPNFFCNFNFHYLAYDTSANRTL